MAYGDFKNLPRKTAVDKVLRDEGFNITRGTSYHKYQRALTSIIYKFFDKKPSGSSVKSEIISNQEYI